MGRMATDRDTDTVITGPDTGITGPDITVARITAHALMPMAPVTIDRVIITAGES
jgi:hypothetical protein